MMEDRQVGTVAPAHAFAAGLAVIDEDLNLAADVLLVGEPVSSDDYPAARQPGSPAARQPGSPAARRRGRASDNGGGRMFEVGGR